MESTMNPNFQFSVLNRRTLLAISRAIAPIEVGVEALDVYILEQIEAQMRQFPRLHRLGFCLGLYFIELGGFIGGWGLLPFSLLKRDRATNRLYRLLHSRLTPIRLLVNGLRVLVCLSAYGHTEVERWFGFERRAWRKQRIATRQVLMDRVGVQEIAPVPEPLYTLNDQKQRELLSWESHQELDRKILPMFNENNQERDPSILNDFASPFNVEDFTDINGEIHVKLDQHEVE
jgi:hypothetical protein